MGWKMGWKMDWNSVLLKQADTAKRGVQSVPRMLAHPDLTSDQCNRLLAGITSTRFRIDMIQASIKAEDASSSFLAVAEQLGQIWDELSVETARRLKAFEETIAA
jgi:hypothetical protein